MKFDSNQGWKDTLANVAANRELLFALAGVFFVLPSFAFALFFPQPPIPPGLTAEQTGRLAQAYYARTLPALVPLMVFEAGGFMALVTIMIDRARPTVGEAIKRSAGSVLTYIAAQMLIGMGAGFAAILLLTIGGLSGNIVILGAAYVAVLVLFAAIGARMMAAAPVVAEERVRNPLRAIARSWALTRGNGGRIAAFLILLAIAAILATIVIMGVIGVVLALVAGGDIARIVAALVSSILIGVMTVYVSSAMVAIYRQLAARAPANPGPAA